MTSKPSESPTTNANATEGEPMDVDTQPSDNAVTKPASPHAEPPSNTSKTRPNQAPPCDEDFVPDISRINLNDIESQRYLTAVLNKCDAETRLNTPAPGRRDVYAFGGVVVKSDFLAIKTTGDYSIMDENECAAVKTVAGALEDIQLPQCYLKTNLAGRDILIQSRISGTTLEAAWPGLTKEQKLRYKSQARDLIRRIHQVKGNASKPSYFVKADVPRISHKLTQDEHDILFGDDEDINGFTAAHNNMVPSNIFVDNDRIVGLADWSSSGYFGYDRAKRVHSTLRCCKMVASDEDDVPWHDLYEIPAEPSDDTKIKTEVPNPSLETVPRAVTSEAPNGPVEFPTPRKVLDLKRGSMSRAGSSERSSPAPSTKGAKKRATPATKKGSATRKSAPKKRRLNDGASTDGLSRKSSGTPAPRGSKAGQKIKQSSMSVAGSPVPEGKGTGDAEDEVDDDDVEDPTQLFCICRKPDNHTWMIACDGSCDDWYHGKCVNIRQADADLIDKYICPICEEKHTQRTTWKPMCRLVSCRQPARVTTKPPSKYCCDDHGREFMQSMVKEAQSNGNGRRKGSNGNGNDDENSNYEEDDDDGMDGDEVGDNHGSRGGVLTKGDLKAVVSQVNSAGEFRKLGRSILASQPAEIKARFGAVDDGKGNLTINLDSQEDIYQFTPEERQQMESLKHEKAKLVNRTDMLHDRDKFVTLLRQQAKHILERLRHADPKGTAAWKDICGFDPRLSWSDEEFDEWRVSDAGRKALDGGLGLPETDVDESGDTKMADENDDEVSRIAGKVCIKRRCEQHRQWFKVQQQDILFEQSDVTDRLAKCNKGVKDVADRIVLRLYGDDH